MSQADNIITGIAESVASLYDAVARAARMEELKGKPLLTPDEVEEFYGLSAATLRTKRSRGGGPDYCQEGTAGPVFYRHKDIEAWLMRHHRKGS